MRLHVISVLAVLVMSAFATSAYATGKIPLLETFDRYCIMTKANPAAIARALNQSPQKSAMDAKAIKGLPEEIASHPILKKQAWTVRENAAPAQIIYREWQSSTKGISQECSVLQKTTGISNLLEALETRYKLKISKQPHSTTQDHYSIHFEGAQPIEVTISKNTEEPIALSTIFNP